MAAEAFDVSHASSIGGASDLVTIHFDLDTLNFSLFVLTSGCTCVQSLLFVYQGPSLFAERTG